MDKKIANSVIVGVIVTVGFLAFVFVLFTMGGGGLFTKSYPLKAKFTRVNGLHQGSEVMLAGLRIGVVKTIEIPPDQNKVLIVTMSLLREYQNQIRGDSVATIKTAGVLGDRYIEISIGNPQQQPLADNVFITSDEPEDILSKSGDLVEGISKQFQKGGEADALLRNLNVLSGNLAAITTDIRKEKGLLHEVIYGTSGAKVNKATEHLQGILRKIDSGEGTIGALINDPTVYEDIKSMMGGAKRSTILQYFMKQFVNEGRKEGENSTPVKQK